MTEPRTGKFGCYVRIPDEADKGRILGKAHDGMMERIKKSTNDNRKYVVYIHGASLADNETIGSMFTDELKYKIRCAIYLVDYRDAEVGDLIMDSSLDYAAHAQDRSPLDEESPPFEVGGMYFEGFGVYRRVEKPENDKGV
jgi:hypothetical protein